MSKASLKHAYHVFLGIIVALIAIGLIFIYSSSSIFALEKFGSPYYFLKKQLVGLLIGVVSAVCIQTISPGTIKQASPLLFFLSLFATALTLFKPFAHRLHGASRWLSLPGVTMQPSELLKIFFVLYLAYVVSKKKYKYSFLRGFLPVLLVLLLAPSIILLLQPDFGLTVTLFLTTLIVLFLANFQVWHIFITLFSIIPLFILLIAIKPYRLQRIITFLNPWSDPTGAGFQVIQSLIAIGSGGFAGVGIAQSKQKFFYLPMQHTDFIFSIIAEELGFLGVACVIGLYIALLYYGIIISRYLTDRFSQSVILGFVVLINLQAMMNISVAAGLIPTKGIGLPFISYGNSALVCNLWMVGIIMTLIRGEIKQQ